MNSKHITKGLLFGASLLLATAAFAGEKATVRVYENVKVTAPRSLPASTKSLGKAPARPFK